MKSTEIVAVLVIMLACAGLPAVGANEQKASVGDCDIAPFSVPVPRDGEAIPQPQARWAEPRKVRQVVVEFADGQALPDPGSVSLQYWHRTWDGQADPVLVERGAGGVGWDAMDDWTNGKWIIAKTSLHADGKRWTFTILPITSQEIKGVKGPGVNYRKTLWVRLNAPRPLPECTMQVFTESSCRPLALRIHFGRPSTPAVRLDGQESIRLEVYNGRIVTAPAEEDSPFMVGEGGVLQLPAGAAGALRVELVMANDPIDARYDRTIVTVRSSHRPFSFAADEVARGDRILVDDLGVLVTNAQDEITLEQYRQALRTNFTGQTIYERIKGAPEQTLSRAWGDMPLKHPLFFVHGLPGNRNTMRQRPNGEIEVTSVGRWFNVQRSPRDSDRKDWKGDQLRISLGLPQDALRGGQRLEEGYLPLLYTWWQDGPIYYEQATILDALNGDLRDIRLDDPTILLVRVRMVNVSDVEGGTGRLRLSSGSQGEDKLIVRQGQVMTEDSRLRLLVQAPDAHTFRTEGNAAVWLADLAPGASKTLYFCIPSVTLSSQEEIKSLQGRSFEADAKRVCEFWRTLTAGATQIHTPEPWINDFYKAHLRHLLVNCFKELDSDRLHAHVGTFHYGVYPNESVMMISDLDRRGMHEQTRQSLDAFLHYQGTVSMPGNFAGREGQFYGAGGHETGGYNKSHGYVMWNMGEHWWMTRDRQWMERSAPGLVKACDWVTNERKATMRTLDSGARVLEYGWLPSGSLEDVTDYWNWLATNSATVWGFRSLADALADFGHPDGPRLQKEAKAYYDDFMRGIKESRIQCPVVKLRDGTYVPKIPSRLYERGRAHGWLRETLEGSLFLPAYQVLDPQAIETKWVLEDYEDNLYISERYGYAIPSFDRFWFSRGGFSMQANLLDGPLPYLWRDEVKHFLRAYFNGFASAFYPEIRLCNEHSLPELGYPAGDHFKTSDEAQSTYWLRLMFVNDQMGPDLYLGQAIPRYWLAKGNRVGIERAPSHFGVLSFHLEADAEADKIRAVVDPPTRNSPKNIFVRVRHPKERPIQSVTINGQPYKQFDAGKEWVILPGTIKDRQQIEVSY
ncbi:MAG: hypothetical protein JW955_21365 [Sedimentisphaerales bacterium]|nr:hypothetical protein [Sedimentisphaerales bacterium]